MSKEEQMRALFEQWRASGKPRATFAREHNVPINTFHYWYQRFEGKRPRSRRGAAETAAASPPPFVEITEPVSSPTLRPQPRMRFDLPDGTSITVY